MIINFLHILKSQADFRRRAYKLNKSVFQNKERRCGIASNRAVANLLVLTVKLQKG